MIIRVEKILSDTFSKIETVKGQNPIWFGYGDKKELDATLLDKNDGKYPLLWYVMPNKLTYQEGWAVGKYTFIIAHNTQLDWRNDQRFAKVYDEILFPYMENVFKTMSRSGNIAFSMDSEYQYTNFPNYGDDLQNKTEQIDFWDAIKLEIDDLKVKEDNNC